MIGTCMAAVAGFAGGVKMPAGPDDDAASTEAAGGFVAVLAWPPAISAVGGGSSGPNRPQPANASSNSVRTKAPPSLQRKG